MMKQDMMTHGWFFDGLDMSFHTNNVKPNKSDSPYNAHYIWILLRTIPRLCREFMLEYLTYVHKLIIKRSLESVVIPLIN